MKITISGPAKTGKTTVAFIIAMVLREYGADVTITMDGEERQHPGEYHPELKERLGKMRSKAIQIVEERTRD